MLCASEHTAKIAKEKVVTRLISIAQQMLALPEDPTDEESTLAQKHDQGLGTAIKSATHPEEFDPRNPKKLKASTILCHAITALGNMLILNSSILDEVIDAGAHWMIQKVLDHPLPLPIEITYLSSWFMRSLCIGNEESASRTLNLVPYALRIAREMNGKTELETDIKCCSEALSTLMRLTLGLDSNTMAVHDCDGMMEFLLGKLVPPIDPSSLDDVLTILRNMWVTVELQKSLIDSSLLSLLRQLLERKIRSVEHLICELFSEIFVDVPALCMQYEIHTLLLELYVDPEISDEAPIHIRRCFLQCLFNLPDTSLATLILAPNAMKCVIDTVRWEYADSDEEWIELVDKIFNVGIQLGTIQRASYEDEDAISLPNPIFDIFYSFIEDFAPREETLNPGEATLLHQLKILLHAGSGFLPSA